MYFKQGSAIEKELITATSGGTLTLTASSETYQIFTGTQNHTLKLPDATTMPKGRRFEVLNSSTGTITVQDSTAAVLGTIAAGASSIFRLMDNSTAAGTYDVAAATGGGGGGLSATETVQFNALAAIGFGPSSRVLKYNKEEVGGNYWTTKTSMNTGRDYHSGFTLNGFGYVCGGVGGAPIDTIEYYHDDNNFWLLRASMPGVMATQTGFDLNGFGYQCAGSTAITAETARNFKYNDSTNTWATKGSLLLARYAPNGFSIGGYGFVNSGEVSSLTDTAETELYSDVNDAWYVRAPNTITKEYSRAAVLNDFAYTGGAFRYVGSTDVATSEKYSYASNSWTTIADYLTAASQYAIGSINGAIYVAGGSGPISTVGEYDDFTNIWVSKASLSGARRQPHGVSLNGIFYATGGATTLTTVEQYKNGVAYTLGLLKVSNAAPSTIAASVLLNNLTSIVGVQIRSDGDTWKNLTSAGGSATKQGETLSIKFQPTGLPFISGSFGAVGSASYAYDVNADSWVQKSGPTTERGSGGNFNINGIGYVAGGQNPAGSVYYALLDAYNYSTDVWTSKTAMPANKAYSQASWNLNGFGYYSAGQAVAGSGTSVTTSYKYNPTANTWSTNTAINSNVAGGGGSIINGRGYVAGGAVSSGSPTSNCQQFNDILGTWVNKTGNASGQYNTGGFGIIGRMYLTGGNFGGDTGLTQYYNDQSDSWSTVASNPNTGSAYEAGNFISGGYAYVAGTNFTAANSRYSPAADLWLSRASLPHVTAGGAGQSFQPSESYEYDLRVQIPAYFAGVGGVVWAAKGSLITARNLAAAGFTGDKSVVVGGYSGPKSSTEAYDSVLDSWSSFTSLPAARGAMCGFVLKGKFYNTTGLDGSSNPTNTTYAFNNDTKVWDTKASTNVANRERLHQTNGGELNGLGYIVGGSFSSNLNSSEQYDQIANTWTTKASTNNSNRDYIGSFTVDGFWTIIGGADFNETSFFNAVEQYDDASNTWITKNNYPTSQEGIGGMLYKGVGYAWGGRSGGSPIASAYKYNPVADSWIAIQSIPTALAFTSSTSEGLSISGTTGSDSALVYKLVPTINNAVLSAGLAIT